MRAYLATTGTIFALVTVLHLVRTDMWSRFPTNPVEVGSYGALTLLSAVLAGWAWRLYVRQYRSSSAPADKQP